MEQLINVQRISHENVEKLDHLHYKYLVWQKLMLLGYSSVIEKIIKKKNSKKFIMCDVYAENDKEIVIVEIYDHSLTDYDIEELILPNNKQIKKLIVKITDDITDFNLTTENLSSLIDNYCKHYGNTVKNKFMRELHSELLNAVRLYNERIRSWKKDPFIKFDSHAMETLNNSTNDDIALLLTLYDIDIQYLSKISNTVLTDIEHEVTIINEICKKLGNWQLIDCVTYWRRLNIYDYRRKYIDKIENYGTRIVDYLSFNGIRMLLEIIYNKKEIISYLLTNYRIKFKSKLCPSCGKDTYYIRYLLSSEEKEKLKIKECKKLSYMFYCINCYYRINDIEYVDVDYDKDIFELVDVWYYYKIYNMKDENGNRDKKRIEEWKTYYKVKCEEIRLDCEKRKKEGKIPATW